MQHRNSPSILTMGEACQKQSQFSFKCEDKDKILKQILNLDASKACQDSGIPSTNFKEDIDFFTNFLYFGFYN